MSDVRNDSPRKGGVLIPGLTALVLVGAGAAIYVMVKASDKPLPPGDMTAMRVGTLAKLEVPGRPRPIDKRMPSMDQGVSPPAAPPPDIPFTDADGKMVKVADFKGKVLVLNLWATWCAPCKIEMPTLAKLSAGYQTQPLEVVAVSADVAEKVPEARTEIAKYAPLKFYAAGGSSFLFKFTPGVVGLPGTIIYDKKGVERARLAGEADWNSPEARKLIETLLAEKA